MAKKRRKTVTPEMIEAIRRGERPLFPDGSHLPRHFSVLAAGNPPGDAILIPHTLRGRLRKVVGHLRGDDRTIVLAPDYGVEVPLWPQSDETDALIPEGLLAKLIAWQGEWDSHFHYVNGWDSEAAKSQWERDEETLAAEVREVLPKGMRLRVGFHRRRLWR